MAGSRILKVTVLGDSRSAQRALGQLSSPVDRVTKSMASAGAKMSIGLTAPLLLAGRQAVAEFSEVQQVTQQTSAALKSTGGVANVTAGDIEHLAARLGRVAQVDAEVVQAAENVLLTFTNVRNEVGRGNAIFDRTSKAALDLSSRLGTDLSSAMLQVGKATNDPIKGVSMLGRAGVQFSEEQKFMIASLQESGDLLGAQKIVLEELETQFGGSAKAAGQARSPLEKLTLAFNDMAEEAGAILVPILEKVASWGKSVAASFRSLPESVQGAVVGVLAFVAALGPLLVVGAKVVTVLKVIGATVATLVAGSGPIGLAIVAIGALTLAITKLAGSGHVADFVNDAVERMKDLRDGVNEELSPAFTAVGESAKTAFRGIGASVATMAGSLKIGKKAVDGFAALTKEGMRNWKDEVSGSLDLVSGTLSALADKAHLTVDKILNAFRKKLDAVSEFGKNIKTLAEKGLSEFAAMTLAKMGEAGAHIAATLVDGTGRDVRTFNKLLKQAEGGAGRFSGAVRSAFGNASGAANGLISSLDGIIAKLNALNAMGVPAVLSNQLVNSGGAGIPSPGGSGGNGNPPPNLPGPTRPRQQTTIVQLDKKTLWTSSTSYGDVHRVVLGGR